MADKKISELTTLAQGSIDADADFLAIVDTNATETKKSTPEAVVLAALGQASAVAIPGTATINSTVIPNNKTLLVSTDIGATVQGYDADTAKYDDATANFTGTLQNGGSNVVVDTDIGATVQAYDATLASLAGVTTGADKVAYFTGVDTASATDLTSFGRSLIDDADASAGRTTLGLGTIATQAADNVNIDGGAIDGTTVGANSASTGKFTQVDSDNLRLDGNTISSTNTDGNIVLDPNGNGIVQEDVGGTDFALASQYDIGTAPNEIPLNQYLGANAYIDTETPALDIGTGITTGTGTICVANGGLSGGVYKVTIVIDLTGLNSGGTAGDIIGVNGTALPCYIARLPAMTVLGGRMTCLELPAGGDTDIDLYAANEGTGTEDSAITGLTETQIINAGTQALGTLTYFSAYPTTNQYLYLVGQSTSNATYTAGRFLIEIFGVQ